MNGALKFSLRLLARDWRAGELHVLLIALIIAVASVTSVGFATDRVAQALRQQGNELLGADLVIVSDQALPQHAARARQLNLQHAATTSFVSMALSGDVNQLAEVKAVSENYPLRGELRIAREMFGAEQGVRTIPAPGTVWADARLLQQLKLKVGDTLTLGAARFTVAALLTREPDRGGDLFSIAPRLLMNLNDVSATGLVQTGSRIRYRLLVAGEPGGVRQFRAGVENSLQPGERLETVEDARPEVRSALTRAERFLGLAALVSVLLAGAAVATAARRYGVRHLDTCAMLRCLGAPQAFITRSYLYQMLWLGVAASLLGCGAGYAAHGLFTDLLGRLIAAPLPPPSLRPALSGFATGLVMLLGFALPPLLALKNVPALRVLRRELGVPVRGLPAYLSGILLLGGLMIWQAGDFKLGAYIVAGTLAALAVLALTAWLLVQGLTRLRTRVGVAWRFGLANIARRPASSVTQILAFGIGIMALLLLTLVRGDLLASWQDSLPREAPNRFIINIQAEQLSALRDFFAQQEMPAPEFYPMVRGRLVSINDRPVSPADYKDERAAHLVEREFNLSWMERLPEDNRIIAGEWWQGAAANLLSVEDGIAATLGIKLGDTLGYSIAGETFTAKVASLRKVDWDSFHVNFFVIAAPGALSRYPASYITSFYLPEQRQTLLGSLVKSFPNLTIIDVAAIMAEVRAIIERVTLALEYVFGFTLLAGFVVLYAALQATRDERLQDTALLRTLGASRRQLLTGLAAEFLLLGALAGLVAALASSVLGYILAEHVLHFPYVFNAWIWLTGLVVGGIGVAAAGVLGMLPAIRHPPLTMLRNA